MRCALAFALLLACGGRPTPGSVKIGVPRYDDFFRAANAVLFAADQGPGDIPPELSRGETPLREQARALGAQALALLESVDRDVSPPKRDRVRRALREAAERLARVR